MRSKLRKAGFKPTGVIYYRDAQQNPYKKWVNKNKDVAPILVYGNTALNMNLSIINL
jgi:hypothetical protein